MNNHAQFFSALRKVCFFLVLVLLQTEHEKPGCWLHFWIVYQNFCKVGVCFDLIDSRHKECLMSSFCCFSVLSSDVGARGYFKSNFAFWPSLVTSSLGEDIPKSWFLGIITPQHCCQSNGASCFVFSHLLHVRLKRNYQDRIWWRDRPCKNWERIYTGWSWALVIWQVLDDLNGNLPLPKSLSERFKL